MAHFFRGGRAYADTVFDLWRNQTSAIILISQLGRCHVNSAQGEKRPPFSGNLHAIETRTNSDEKRYQFSWSIRGR